MSRSAAHAPPMATDTPRGTESIRISTALPASASPAPAFYRGRPPPAARGVGEIRGPFRGRPGRAWQADYGQSARLFFINSGGSRLSRA